MLVCQGEDPHRTVLAPGGHSSPGIVGVYRPVALPVGSLSGVWLSVGVWSSEGVDCVADAEGAGDGGVVKLSGSIVTVPLATRKTNAAVDTCGAGRWKRSGRAGIRSVPE